MAACLIKLDRVFLKRNGGFSLHHIEGTAASNPAWDTQQPFPEEILSQPFFYLGKGSQTYVFESRDKKYVVKFYKFPSHMRKISWLRHPLAYRFDPKRIRIKEHNEKRHNLSYNSFFLASSELSEETSVVYAHLNPTEHLHRNITLVDRLKAEYTLSLDSMGFVVQRKATPLLSALQSLIEKNDIATGKKVVEGTVDLIVARCKKGITDLDSMMHDNYGWVDGRAIHIDIGRFVHDETVKEPANCQKEVVRITQVLSDYLALHSPELHDCYQKKVSAVTNQ
jgi:hypothetical protein